MKKFVSYRFLVTLPFFAEAGTFMAACLLTNIAEKRALLKPEYL
jgi:hypothetical protein